MFGKKNDMDIGMPMGGKAPLVILEQRNQPVMIYDLPAVIGRNGEEADVYVFDNSVSRVHCKLDIYDGVVTITDLYSTMGTKVAGNELVPGQPYMIEDGHKIALGKCKFKAKIDHNAIFSYQQGHVSAQSAAAPLQEQQVMQEAPKFSFDDMELTQAQPQYDYDNEVTEPLNPVREQAEDGEKTEVIFFGGNVEPKFTKMHLIEEGVMEPACVIDKTPFFIGRKPEDNDAGIDVAGVSRQHMRVDKIGEEFFVTDLESTNGVYINGEKIEPNVQTKVAPGDRIVLGEKEFNFDEHR